MVAFQDEGASRPVDGSFSWPLGDGASVTAFGGGGGASGAFDIEDGKIVRCGLQFGRQWLTCEETALGVLEGDSAPSGVIYASVRHSASGATLSVEHAQGAAPPDSTLDVTNRLLYKGENGSWADYRNAVTLFVMN